MEINNLLVDAKVFVRRYIPESPISNHVFLVTQRLIQLVDVHLSVPSSLVELCADSVDILVACKQLLKKLKATELMSNFNNSVNANILCDDFVFMCARIRQFLVPFADSSMAKDITDKLISVESLSIVLNEEVKNLRNVIESLKGNATLMESGDSSRLCLDCYPLYEMCDGFSQLQEDLSVAKMAFRDVLGDIVCARSPLDFNPYRDAIFATTVGSKFNAQERAVILDYLEQSSSSQVVQMFKEKANDHDIGSTVSNDELMMYFGCQNKQIDLAGALTCAIDHVVDRTIDKHLDQPASYFVGQILVLVGVSCDRADTNGALDMSSLSVEIIECVKDASGGVHCLLKNSYGRLFKLSASPQTHIRDSLLVTLTVETSLELGKFLCGAQHVEKVHLSMLPDRLRNKKSIGDVMCSTGDYTVRRCFASTPKPGVLRSVYSALVGKSVVNPGPLLQEFINIAEVDGKSVLTRLIFTQDSESDFIVDKNKETFVDDAVRYQHHKRHPITMSVASLNQYRADFTHTMLDREVMPFSRILLKKKRVDPNEVRCRKLQELQRVKQGLMACFKQESHHHHLECILFHLVGSDLEFNADHGDLIDAWLCELPGETATLFQTMNEVCFELSIDRCALVSELLLDLVMLRVLDSRTMSLSALEIMNRLTVSHEYLKDLAGRDLILFVGETGAGKSTTLNYFAGYSLVVSDTGPVRVIKVDTDDNQNTSCAKIGTSLIASETTFVRGFKVLQRDRKFWDKSKGAIDFENLLLCDLPGFHDTRGEGYDLSAALSITRAVKGARSIKGIVLVIPYSSMFIERGNVFIANFVNLQEMFEDGFAGLTLDERAAIHLVISQSKDPDSDKVKFTQLLEEFCSETAILMSAPGRESDEHLLCKMDIWRFIQEMLNANRVLFVSVVNRFQKTQFLSTCAASRSSSFCVPVSKFTEVFERGAYQKAFSDCLQRSLSIWHKLLLQRYLDDTTNSLVLCVSVAHKDMCEIAKLTHTNHALVTQVEARKSRCNGYTIRLEELRKLSTLGASATTSESIRQELESLESSEVQKKEVDLQAMMVKISELNSLLEQRVSMVKCKGDHIRTLEVDEERSLAKIKLLSTGNVTKLICDMNTRGVDSKINLFDYKVGALENMHAEVRAATNADKEEGSERWVRAGSHIGVVWYTYHIAKDFRVVPHVDAEKMNTFFGCERVDIEGGRGLYWIATMKGHNAVISTKEGRRPKAAPGGKSIIYTIELTYDGGDKPLPWFKIEHNMPCIDMNYADIEGEQDIVTQTRRTIATQIRELAELTSEFSSTKEKLTRLRNSHSALKLDLSTLKIEQFANSVDKLIGKYLSLVQKEEQGVCSDRAEAAVNEKGIAACKLKIEETEGEANGIKVEKICLAIVIKKQLAMAKCIRDFAGEACDLSSHTAQTLQRRADQSNGATSTLFIQCIAYMDYYDEHCAALVHNCDLDLAAGNADLKLLQSRVDRGRARDFEDEGMLVEDDDESLNETLEVEPIVINEGNEMPPICDAPSLRFGLVRDALLSDWSLIPSILFTKESMLPMLALQIAPDRNSSWQRQRAGSEESAARLQNAIAAVGCDSVACSSGRGNGLIEALYHQLRSDVFEGAFMCETLDGICFLVVEWIMSRTRLPPMSELFHIVTEDTASVEQLVLAAIVSVTETAVVLVYGMDERNVLSATHSAAADGRAILLGFESPKTLGCSFFSLVPQQDDGRYREWLNDVLLSALLVCEPAAVVEQLQIEDIPRSPCVAKSESVDKKRKAGELEKSDQQGRTPAWTNK